MKLSNWFLILSCAGCAAPAKTQTPTASETTSEAAAPSTVSAAPSTVEVSAAPTAEASAPSSGAAAAASSARPPAPVFTLPPLVDDQGQPLPQTDALPSADSEFFRRLASELFAAIAADDPERAKPFFFPVVAYKQVKDIAAPERDHEKRLLHHFERDIHQYHAKLGEDAAGASFVALEVPMSRASWMKPGKEGNRVGYHRVTRSSLVYQTAQGEQRKLEVTSLISWRGEWYIVHLHGFE